MYGCTKAGEEMQSNKAVKRIFVILSILLIITLIGLVMVRAELKKLQEERTATVPNNRISAVSAMRFSQIGTISAQNISVPSLKISEDTAPFHVGNMLPGDSNTNEYKIRVTYRDSTTIHFHPNITEDGYCIITADENTYKLEVESHDIKTLTIRETTTLRIEKYWGHCPEDINITQDTITGQSEVPSQDVPKDEPEEIIDDKELDNKPEPEIPEEADKNEPIPEQNENKETEENEKESIPDAEHEGEDSTALPDSETSHDAIDETNCVNAEQTNETAD